MSERESEVSFEALFVGSSEPAFDYLVEVITLSGPARQRMWSALTLRARAQVRRARLRKRGATDIRTFVAVPTLEAPTFLYELNTPAAGYAANNLQLGHRGRLRIMRRGLSLWMGCDPAAGAVVLIGKRA